MNVFVSGMLDALLPLLPLLQLLFYMLSTLIKAIKTTTNITFINKTHDRQSYQQHYILKKKWLLLTLRLTPPQVTNSSLYRPLPSTVNTDLEVILMLMLLMLLMLLVMVLMVMIGDVDDGDDDDGDD